MAKRNNSDNPETPKSDEINDGNEEVTIETAGAEQARAEKLDEDKTDAETLNGPEEGPTGDSYTGGYPKDMDSSFDGEKISVETTGDFQLYDVTTRTTFPAKGSIEVPENSQFVQTNLTRGKLKKA